MLWTLTVVPALLVMIAPRRLGVAAAPLPVGRQEAARGPWAALAGFLCRWPLPTLAVAAIGLALCPLGIRRLVVQDSWISGFAPESEFYRATHDFNRSFYGTHRLLLAIDAGQRIDLGGTLLASDLSYDEIRLPAQLVAEPAALVGCSLSVAPRTLGGVPATPELRRAMTWSGIIDGAARRGDTLAVTFPSVAGSALFMISPVPSDTLDFAVVSRRLAVPAVLRRIADLERYAGAQSGLAVGGVLGPADQVATAEFLVNERDPEFRAIPSDPDRLAWLWQSMRSVQGDTRMREVVDPTLQRALVTVFLKDANYVDTAALMDSLRAYERDHLAPERMRLDFAGDVAVSQTLIEAIVTSQVRSVLGSLLGILAVTALLFRSLRWGLLCTVPAALAVAATFGVMGWTDMPLGVATSMFAAMVLGNGVDFAIHLVARFRAERARGAELVPAVRAALAVTGPAIAVNALALVLGFGLLGLSSVPANARLGAITAVGLLACLAATVLVLPALLRGMGGGRNDRGGGRVATSASQPSDPAI
jgi:predicted RND superfamily exporter protein